MIGTPCGEPATMVVYLPHRVPMCTRHGSLLSEDTDKKWSHLRPSDPKESCAWLCHLGEP